MSIVYIYVYVVSIDLFYSLLFVGGEEKWKK